MDADEIIRSQASMQPAPARAVKPNAAAGCLYLFALPFCAFGVFALATAVGYVRAGNPAQAAYGALFAIIFGGVGFGLVYALRRGRRMMEGRDRLRAAHPDEPWLWREDWAAGRIPASIGNSPFLLGGFAAFCFVIAAPVVYQIPREMARGNNLVLLILLFPLAGLSLLVQAVRAAARLRLVRGAAFQMDSVPGRIGGTLAGKIVLPQSLRPTGGFTLGLRCVNRVTSGSGDSTSTWEHVLWNDEQTAAFDGATVPVAFYIAPETPASDDANRNNEIIWRLRDGADGGRAVRRAIRGPALQGRRNRRAAAPRRIRARGRASADRKLRASGGLAHHDAPDAGRCDRGLLSTAAKPRRGARDRGLHGNLELVLVADALSARAALLRHRMGFLRGDLGADSAEHARGGAGAGRRRRGYDSQVARRNRVLAPANRRE